MNVHTPVPIHLMTQEMGSEKKDGKFYVEKFKNIVKELGTTKVVALITDNDSTMIAATRTVAKSFPGMFQQRCFSHVLNLFLLN